MVFHAGNPCDDKKAAEKSCCFLRGKKNKAKVRTRRERPGSLSLHEGRRPVGNPEP
jgi:hypothetical protein